MRSICIIPARGGSKRIPRKNIKLFFGKPFLAHTALIASDAAIFDEIIVSTDSVDVKEVCDDVGLRFSFPRPASLADDFSPVYEVMKYEISKLSVEPTDIITCLYATSVLLDPLKLREAFKQHLSSKDVSYTFGVTQFPFPPQRGLLRSETGKVRMLDDSKFLTRSQDLPKIWHDTGTFYIGCVREWFAQPFTFNSNSIGYPLAHDEIQDIDNQDDWEMAEIKYLKKRKEI